MASFEEDVPELDLGRLPMLEQIVQAGYRALAMKTHPDKGGDKDEFLKVQEGRKQLEKILHELKDVL